MELESVLFLKVSGSTLSDANLRGLVYLLQKKKKTNNITKNINLNPYFFLMTPTIIFIIVD